MSFNRVLAESDRSCCNNISPDSDRGRRCRCRDCECDDNGDEVGGVTERDCFTIREGNIFCICVRNPRSWR